RSPESAGSRSMALSGATYVLVPPAHPFGTVLRHQIPIDGGDDHATPYVLHPRGERVGRQVEPGGQPEHFARRRELHLDAAHEIDVRPGRREMLRATHDR